MVQHGAEDDRLAGANEQRRRVAKVGAQAAAHARQAADIQRATGHRLGQARALLILGHALNHTGDEAAGEAAWRDALTLFTSIGSPEGDQVRALLPARQARGSQPAPST